MKKYLAVFRSRTDVLFFIERLRENGVFAKTVPTPKELKLGCGISAEFSNNSLALAKKLINTGNFPSFYSFVSVENRGGRTLTVKI
jgi:hypothetical protein